MSRLVWSTVMQTLSMKEATLVTNTILYLCIQWNALTSIPDEAIEHKR